MALVKGANSYVDVAEADAYFSSRMESSVWTTASTEDKEASLVTATDILNNISWKGSTSSHEALAFPRDVTYLEPRHGDYVQVVSDTPERIRQATYEQAKHLLLNPNIRDAAMRFDRLKVDVIELEVL